MIEARQRIGGYDAINRIISLPLFTRPGRQSEIESARWGSGLGSGGTFVGLVVGLVNYGVIITVVEQAEGDGQVADQAEREMFERVAKLVTPERMRP